MRTLFAAASLVIAAAATAQYTVVELPVPPGATGLARSIDGGQTAGNLGSLPGVWTTPVSGFMDLSAPGFAVSIIQWSRGGEQVGFALALPFSLHGCVWNGTPGTFAILDAPGASSTTLYGTDGTHQVGVAELAGEDRGVMFTGTPGSMVDLHPAGFVSSVVHGVGGGQQAGYAFQSGSSPHAILWSGTAASAVDLNPIPGESSFAFRCDGAQQVGLVFGASTGGNYRPALWSGSAASYVDLTVPGFTYGIASSVRNGQQVGYLRDSGNSLHAFVWSGSAASGVDLNQFLPPGFTEAAAYDIDSDGTICGYMSDGSDIRPILWVPTVPPYDTSGFEGWGVDGTTVQKSKNLLLKFELKDADGNLIDGETGEVSLEKVGPPNTVVDPALYGYWPWGTTVSQSGGSKWYMYNLSTKNLEPGEYRVTVTLSTGQKIQGTFFVN